MERRSAILGKAGEQRIDCWRERLRLAGVRRALATLTLTESACTLAKQRDFLGITTKSMDVTLDPFQSEALVEEAKVVTCQWQFRRAWKAEYYRLSELIGRCLLHPLPLVL